MKQHKTGGSSLAAMATPHYSLRWNNHQNHILHAFDTLLQNETLVDVTLVCEETSVRAHKVVLSACSPYFQRIFSENPCKHPVIVLKDLRGWEVQAIVDFMYKGEISVGQEQLSSLIKAAESLQVRGLAHTETVISEKENAHSTSFSPPPDKLNHYPNHVRNFSTGMHHDKESGLTILSPFSGSPTPHYEAPVKLPILPHMPHISFSDNPQPPGDQGTSPQPRRKQARPRRRSGELCGAQDLSKCPSPPQAETPENLSMKKSTPPNHLPPSHAVNHIHRASPLPQPPQARSTPVSSPHPPLSFKLENDEQQMAENSRADMQTPDQERERERERERDSRERVRDRERDRESRERERERERDRAEYCNSLESLGLPPQPPDSSMDNSNFPHLPSMSALSLTPPHMFSLDSPLGFFPGMDACRNSLLNEIHQEPRNDNHHIMGKRKMGRPKGQHSAPRGGPPRSWTNAELTEALQHVWNKKMTTSQASRIFGIPYNSLLMYVRGKYGKSLKLEQLKKDCLGSPGGPLELLGLGPLGPIGSNNNNNNTGKSNHMDDVGLPPEHDLMPPGFNPYSAANFYPDFTGSFPIPVSMIHLLPQSEKNRELFPHGMPHILDMSPKDDDCKSSSGRRSRDNNNSSAEEENDIIHQQIPLPREDVTQMLEQNGQN